MRKGPWFREWGMRKVPCFQECYGLHVKTWLDFYAEPVPLGAACPWTLEVPRVVWAPSKNGARFLRAAPTTRGGGPIDPQLASGERSDGDGDETDRLGAPLFRRRINELCDLSADDPRGGRGTDSSTGGGAVAAARGHTLLSAGETSKAA